jgi:AraC-like DNA-binding protein
MDSGEGGSKLIFGYSCSEAQMIAQEAAFASRHFSTLALPHAERLPALKKLFGEAVQLDIETAAGHPVEMSMMRSPGLRRARMHSPLTARMERPKPKLADGEDTVCLMIKNSGTLMVSQSGRDGVPETGDGVFLVYREPATLAFEDATYLSIRVPFAALSMVADVEHAAAHCIPGRNEALMLLQAYVANLPCACEERLAALAAAHVYDLMALALAPQADGRNWSGEGGLRAGRLAAVKRDLARNPLLSLDVAAARRKVSPRHVQMLFEEAGTTFSLFALELKLEAARRMILSPRYTRAAITSIALDAGFNDLSYFNRTFKRRFGMTPTHMRSMGSGSIEPIVSR